MWENSYGQKKEGLRQERQKERKRQTLCSIKSAAGKRKRERDFKQGRQNKHKGFLIGIHKH